MASVMLFVSVSPLAHVFVPHNCSALNTDSTQGLYPTLIVILICTEKSPVEYYTTYSTGMQFKRGPTHAQLNVGGMPGDVYMIGQEYVSDSESHMQVASMVEEKTV